MYAWEDRCMDIYRLLQEIYITLSFSFPALAKVVVMLITADMTTIAFVSATITH